MEFLDCYQILGVPFGATHDQIERAYKLLARMSHPDAFPNDARAQTWANERMKQINQAYDELRDPQRRAAYDRTYTERKAADEPPHQQQRRETYQRTYNESLVPCPLCERHGRVPCLTCDGRGSLGCPGCQGRGVTICPLCEGVGMLTESQAREFYEAWERSQQQARAQAARQEAEAAARRRIEQSRETRRRVVMAGASGLLLLFVGRSWFNGSGAPAVSSNRQIAPVVQPTPYRPAVQPTRRAPPRSVTTSPRSSLRSIHSQIPTEVTFRNLTNNPVRVIWIDYEGRERRYRTLAPGESYMQPTFATHPWRLRDAKTGRTLRTIVAVGTPSQVVVGQIRRVVPTSRPAATPIPFPSTPAAPAMATPAVTPQGPIIRFLTELPTILQLQTSTGGSGFLFGQPYQAAVLHTNQSGLIMRSVYNLNGEYDRFEATVGVADNGNLLQRATARVLGDGQVLFESPTLGSGETPARVSVSVRGVTRLELQTTALPVVMTVIWADPKLIKESR